MEQTKIEVPPTPSSNDGMVAPAVNLEIAGVKEVAGTTVKTAAHGHAVLVHVLGIVAAGIIALCIACVLADGMSLVVIKDYTELPVITATEMKKNGWYLRLDELLGPTYGIGLHHDQSGATWDKIRASAWCQDGAAGLRSCATATGQARDGMAVELQGASLKQLLDDLGQAATVSAMPRVIETDANKHPVPFLGCDGLQAAGLCAMAFGFIFGFIALAMIVFHAVALAGFVPLKIVKPVAISVWGALTAGLLVVIALAIALFQNTWECNQPVIPLVKPADHFHLNYGFYFTILGYILSLIVLCVSLFFLQTQKVMEGSVHVGTMNVSIRGCKVLASVVFGLIICGIVSISVLAANGTFDGDASSAVVPSDEYCEARDTGLASAEVIKRIGASEETDEHHILHFRQYYLAEPYTQEAHEIVYVNSSNSLFMSMLTQSTLYDLPLDKRGDVKDVDEHVLTQFGDRTTAGLHNVVKSTTHGDYMLWLSTQCENRVMLVDSNNLLQPPKYLLDVPTVLVTYDEDGNEVCKPIGGPHCVREAKDGSIWVALKGFYPSEVVQRQICVGPAWDLSLKDNFGYAFWHIHPDKYDPDDYPAKGGILYEAMKSPVMSDFDGYGNSFNGQDSVPFIQRVDPEGNMIQIELPYYNGVQFPSSGPCVVAMPDGGVVVASLFREDGAMLRFEAGSITPLILTALVYNPTVPGDWASPTQGMSQRVIHAAFSSEAGISGKANVGYFLTSSLIDPSASEAVVLVQFSSDWKKVICEGPTVGSDCGQIAASEADVGAVQFESTFDSENELGVDNTTDVIGIRRAVLPGYNTGTHRVVVVEGPHVERRSVYVTGTLTDSVTQVYAYNGDF